jgi:hypothetical protein
MAGLQTELLFEMRVDLDLDKVQEVDVTPHGTRLIGYITGRRRSSRPAQRSTVG